MLLANIPAWFAKAFGADAGGSYIRDIPATTADPDAASMALGFPPNTFVDQGAGGSPPDGRDFNGVLNFLAAWAQWQGAGGPIPWNSVVAAAGYPLGAIVGSNSTAGLRYRSTVDGNTTNPDAAGAGWMVVDSLIDQSLAVNLGYRSWASGFKECWGRISISGNSSVTITLPVTHTSFMVPTIAGEIALGGGAANQTGIRPVALNQFDAVNNDGVARVLNWHTRGV